MGGEVKGMEASTLQILKKIEYIQPFFLMFSGIPEAKTYGRKGKFSAFGFCCRN
jgi:hypothetical protein